MAREVERQCIVTRQVKPDAEMIRFVVGPEDRLVPDVAAKLPGRGMWLTASRLLLAEAIAKRSFGKAAKQTVEIPDNLQALIEQLLRQRVRDALSMARKAGQLLSGHDKVLEALAKEEVVALLHASDASEDGVRKMKAGDVPAYRGFSRDLLSEVTGKENAVHVAVLKGSASAFFLSELRRFALFMEETGL
jgi:predicted RNA-binding protein YlxR (DUF448 family)